MDQLNGSADHGIIGAINQCLPGRAGLFELAGTIRLVEAEHLCRKLWVELVDLGTATLDQNNQHNGEQNAGYNANESYAVHGESS